MKCLMLFLFLFVPSQATSAEEVIFKLIKQSQYRNAWIKLLFKTNQPEWVKHFPREMYGVAEPVKNIEILGERYKASNICEQHNCMDSWIVILFADKGERAWALTPSYTNDSSKCAWYGAPTNVQRQILHSFRPKCK